MAYPGPDSGSVPAGSTSPVPAVGEDAVVRRTRDGWRVGGTDVPDLTCAMVLADLLAAEQQAGPTARQPGDARAAAGQAPPGPAAASAQVLPSPAAEPGPPADTGRLRATISQLEHALTARIRVEQAIGVLAERHRIMPRQAFEQLRTAARNRGRRVIDIASDVVASATNPLLQLPDELSRPRSSARNKARPPRGALETD